MVCSKWKFSHKKISKLSLNLCFTADLHHLQDHFSNFLLNFSSLAKNAKREIWRQKGDLRYKICNCIKCLALNLLGVFHNQIQKHMASNSMRITELILPVILVTCGYENPILSLNHVVDLALSIMFESCKLIWIWIPEYYYFQCHD